MSEIDIDQEIEDREHEIRELRVVKREKVFKEYIKPLDEITDAEKIAWFDKTWERAHKEVTTKVNEGENYCDDNDNQHWAWEAFIEILGPSVFGLYRRTDLGVE